MTFSFPTLNPLLSGLPPNTPASPSSTSVSSASGPEDLGELDAGLFLSSSGRTSSRQDVMVKANWKGKSRAKARAAIHDASSHEDGSSDSQAGSDDDIVRDEWEVRELGIGGDKLPYEIWVYVSWVLSQRHRTRLPHQSPPQRHC